MNRAATTRFLRRHSEIAQRQAALKRIENLKPDARWRVWVWTKWHKSFSISFLFLLPLLIILTLASGFPNIGANVPIGTIITVVTDSTGPNTVATDNAPAINNALAAGGAVIIKPSNAVNKFAGISSPIFAPEGAQIFSPYWQPRNASAIGYTDTSGLYFAPNTGWNGGTNNALIDFENNGNGLFGIGLSGGNLATYCCYINCPGVELHGLNMKGGLTNSLFSTNNAQNCKCDSVTWSNGFNISGSDWLLSNCNKQGGQGTFNTVGEATNCHFTLGSPSNITLTAIFTFTNCHIDSFTAGATAMIIINNPGSNNDSINFDASCRFFINDNHGTPIPFFLHQNTNDTPINFQGQFSGSTASGGKTGGMSCIISNPVPGDTIGRGVAADPAVFSSNIVAGSTGSTLNVGSSLGANPKGGQVNIAGSGITTYTGVTATTLTGVASLGTPTVNGQATYMDPTLYLTSAGYLAGPTVGGPIILGGSRYPTGLEGAHIGATDVSRVAWTFDSMAITSAFSVVSTTIYANRIVAETPGPITLIEFIQQAVGTGGGSLTAGQNFVGIADRFGNVLATSATTNIDAQLASPGLISGTVPSTQLIAGQVYFLFLVLVHSFVTPPTVSRGPTSTAAGNIGLSGSNARFVTAGTNASSTPPAGPFTYTAALTSIWMDCK